MDVRGVADPGGTWIDGGGYVGCRQSSHMDGCVGHVSSMALFGQSRTYLSGLVVGSSDEEVHKPLLVLLHP